MNGDRLPDVDRDPHHPTFDRGRDLDGRLVGHDGGEDLVFTHQVAHANVHLDNFGLGHAFADVGQLDDAHRHSRRLQHAFEGFRNASRPREVLPLLCMRIRRIPSGHTLDRGLQVIEASLLHER